MSTPPFACELALVTLVAFAAAYDLRQRRIPNWLVLAGLCIGFLLNIALGRWDGLTLAALGAGAALAIYLPLFALRVMGAGDVKLMAAVGSLIGARNWMVLFLLAAIVGGILAVVLLLVRGGLVRALRSVVRLLGELVRLRAPYRNVPSLDVGDPGAVTLPHAVSIAAGAALFLAMVNAVRP